MDYIGKSNPRQTVWQHTEEALRLWSNFEKIYGEYFSETERALIYWALYYHDVGKISPHFQWRMCDLLNRACAGKKPEGLEIPHGFLSCAYMDVREFEEKYGEWTELLVTAIYNHHKRPDAHAPAEVKAYITSRMPAHYKHDGNVTLHRNTDYMHYVVKALGNRLDKGTTVSEEEWRRYAVIKGMLNKFDYAASDGNVDEAEIEPLPQGVLTRRVRNKWPILRPVQAYMKERRSQNLVVLAATGSGKTEAALYWIDGDKCFYTLPLKVSINAIYERILDEYAYDKAKITLLHSDLQAYYLARQEEDERLENSPLLRQSRAKLLSYPLTICTVDQLFWFVFRPMGSEIIPATLKYARLIIDEIQMYSPDILACLIYGLKIITAIGGKFAVMTATFPPVLGHFMRRKGIEFTTPRDPFLGEPQKRHKIKIVESDFDDDQIAAAGQACKVLVLCNTVGKAQAVYKKLRDRANCRLLHSQFIRRDRGILEKAIMDFSRAEGCAGIWVSTQIVEASLDIDFDLLFTEMCPADSLLQRMGRCYRKRDQDYDGDKPNVYIHREEGAYEARDKYVYRFKEIYTRSLDLLRRHDGAHFSESDKFRYVEQVYDVERIKDGAYYRQIEDHLSNLKNLLPAEFDEKKSREQFRDIQSTTLLPDKFYQLERVRQCIDILSHKKDHALETQLKAKSDLMDHAVSVNANTLKSKKKNAYVDRKPIEKIRWMDVHLCTARYDFDGETGLGLCLEEEEARDRFF